ncbi:DUF4179 domain-containing protein [Lederbergia wuyishanensis]|uniref:RNA polymerase sigma factor (Sigma-70 family) n=1 Tax=Lederbergia wuyishanensis TaxID=1347903 RepID=A0ABU0D4K1_9BACI|nr:DUF4179 domain-containing protein [Lederbergia wuyishanensis]MCJ8008077.1 DUF4179 domain-containing protein [Lederbergia wuyishanensis]MDQ0343338.1 RNA polymerase sigma factor (sigma-70 family) [Lederbergia wuyishanensis]
MIPAKIDSMSITTIRENGMEFIVNWFEQHKESFYTFGWCYLRNQQQIEDLFYRAIIKVHEELPRYKRETSFEMWVRSIFLHICRELSNDKSLQVSEEGEPRQELFKALDHQLKADEKEAVLLTYIMGISREESAHLLQVSAEKMNELLLSGIQSLRKEKGNGSSFNGCKKYYKNYIDYLTRTLERSKKIDFEKHFYHCQDCQEDLGTFQDVMLNLKERIENFHVPSGFMENVKDKLDEKEQHEQQKNKKRQRIGFIFASVLALLIGIEVFTGFMTNLYYAWTEEDEQLRAFLQHGFGERLNLEAESNGVKIKIKSVIADDIQTLVFYEIEDSAEDNQYMMDYNEGFIVENKHEIMSRDTSPMYYPPDLKSDLNNREKNVYHGKLSLLPLKMDNGTIKLKITKLQKLIGEPSVQNNFMAQENMEYETGEWNFEIPVTKQPSIEYTLDEKTEVEGVPVRFDKLTIAPTATILHCSYIYDLPEKRIHGLAFDSLQVNNKKVEANMYGSYGGYENNNWLSYQIQFSPLFVKKPKVVNIQFQSVDLMVNEQKFIVLDASKTYPQSFEYAGSTISIDKVEVGQPTKVVISNHEIENREYLGLNFDIVSEEGENVISSSEYDSEGVLIDKNGIEYDLDKNPYAYEEIEQPRYFYTVQSVALYSNDAEEAEKAVIPIRLEIHGYNTTKYLDDVVTFTLR